MCGSEEVVRAPLLPKVGFTRTVLFPAHGSLELLSAHYSFTAAVFSLYTLFKCCYKMDGEGCGRIRAWKWEQLPCRALLELGPVSELVTSTNPEELSTNLTSRRSGGVCSLWQHQTFRSHHKAPPFVDEQSPWLNSSPFPATKKQKKKKKRKKKRS